MVIDIDLTRSTYAIIAHYTKLGSVKHSEEAYPATAVDSIEQVEAIERNITLLKLELENNLLLFARATIELQT